jgi:GntR family transcriptional regulator
MNGTAFNKIRAHIEDSVLHQQLTHNQQIPSIEKLSIQLRISTSTIMGAYNFLQKKGVYYKRRGLGFFLSFNALQTVREYRWERFWQKELPPFWNTMLLLKIEFADLMGYKKDS